MHGLVHLCGLFLSMNHQRKMKDYQVSCLLVLLLGLAAAFIRSDASQTDALTKLMKKKAAGKIRSDNDDDMLFKSAFFVDLDKVILKQNGLKEKDKITKLPGQPDGVRFDQYGGYVTVDEKAGRALFYYFVESEVPNPSSKPLLLWLNGGPGCSSLGFGAMEELGPFRVKSDGKTLYKNMYAWNKVANVLFLESPAGVGFSYSNTTTDYNSSGDQQTANDAYVFLVNWLERFPEYKTRDFYISGESYAGHYVPQLAHTILHHNKLSNKTIINLKGVTIGNAVINDETDNLGMYDYFWTHALISDETIQHIHKHCDFSPNGTWNARCNLADAETDVSIDPIDIYNIYAPLCFSSNLTTTPKKASIMRFDPCSDIYVQAYLNLPEVQEAFHANVTKINSPWSACGDLPWGDSPSTIIPLLEEFIANGIRVWVYSGDIDGRVPVTSTRYSLNKLNLPVRTKWQPWYLNKEVGGYSVEYEGLTLATVRGAGHEVPSYQPPRALMLIKFFLDGKPLPSDD